MAVSQLAYVGIGVSDMMRWKAFAADVLGLQVVEGEADGTVFLRMDEYHHRLALHPTGEDDVRYIGLQVATDGRLRAGEGRAARRRRGGHPGNAATRSPIAASWIW